MEATPTPRTGTGGRRSRRAGTGGQESLTDLVARPDTGQMELDDELTAIGHVVDRLAARFPLLPREWIEQAVYSEYAALDGAIREYVPVLVEHGAKERLRKQRGAAYT